MLALQGSAPPGGCHVRRSARQSRRVASRVSAAKAPDAPSAWPPPKPVERGKRGDPLLWGTGMRKSHDGERVQFDGVDVTLEKGMKMAVVGPNGCGKSTLLRALAGLDRELDAGDVQVRRGTRVAFLPQEPEFDTELPVLAAVLQGEAPVLRLLRRYEAALAAAGGASPPPAAAAELAALTSEMDAADAWGVEAALRTVLDKLGCTPLLGKTMGQLSGGQAKRVALAGVLVSTPDVLILDEPTNHLSVQGVEWLEERLAEAALTVLMVTHDRSFMDTVCSDVLELDGSGGAFRHSGGYERFLLGREERLAAVQAAADNAATVLRREEAWMAKQPRARQAKSVARQGAFYRLQDAAAALPQRMGTIDVADGAVRASRLGDISVELRGASLALGGQTLLRDFSYAFSRGERVGIVGKNGVGKSTFLNICRGAQAVDTGAVVIGETVRFGTYEQMARFENPEQRVADYVQQLAADAREDDAAGRDWNGWTVTELLKRFQFSRGRQAASLNQLSGGEKRRLQLLTVLSKRPNFLILDELTNDLDLDTIEAVEAMLQGFDGVVLMTGHDRAFMDTLAQHIFVFEGDGVVRDWQGSYSELRESQKAEAEAAAAPPKTSTDAAAAPPARDAAVDREARRLATNARNKIPKVEAALEAIEAEIAVLDEALVAACADAGKAAQLAAQRDAAVAKQEELYDEYARLDALVAAGGLS